MLLGEGAVDGLGLLIAIAPLVLGLSSALVRGDTCDRFWAYSHSAAVTDVSE